MSGAPDLFAVLDATWPAAALREVDPWLIREGRDGGQRVSAATALGPVEEGDIAAAEDRMRALGQPLLFQMRGADADLDAMLAQRGYDVVDPVNIYLAPVDTVATEPPPPVTAFTIWEPLALQLDIWADAGIGPGRIAVMHRASGPKTSLLGRLNDHPAATGFVAIHAGVAMVHALEVLAHQRRQKMGVYAMRAAAFWAREHGARHLSVICTRANEGANGLYASLGMSVVEQYHYRRKQGHPG